MRSKSVLIFIAEMTALMSDATGWNRTTGFAGEQAGTACLLVSKASRLTLGFSRQLGLPLAIWRVLVPAKRRGEQPTEGFAQKAASRKLPLTVSSRQENDPLGFSHLLMIQHVMSKTQYPSSLWQLLGGIFLAYLGLVLIGCGQWNLLPIGSPVFLYAGGFLLCMLGPFGN